MGTCQSKTSSALDSGKVALPSVRIIMLGDVSVGKSSLLLRFTGHEFRETTPTMAVDMNHQEVTLDEQCFRIQLWDTSGQERFHAIAKQFYRNANGVILVYDETQPESFNNLRTYWIEELKKQNCPATHILIVGNKTDLLHCVPGVPVMQLSEFAEQYHSTYVCTTERLSAATQSTEQCLKVYHSFCDRLLRDTYGLAKIDPMPPLAPGGRLPPVASPRSGLPPVITLDELCKQTT